MTLITFQDGKPVMRDGKVGTEQDCCCDGGDCQCCSAEEYEDCEIEIRRILPDNTHIVIDTVPAASLFTNAIGVGCRFEVSLGDENPNGDTVCRINGEIDTTIETCEDCETAGGECISCCDSPRIVACMKPTEDGLCQLTIQVIDDCDLNATAPIGVCNGYEFVMSCNPLP